jgi:hypothetical protein
MSMHIWRGLFIVLVAAIVVVPTTIRSVSAEPNRVAIKGYDPVAYFTEGRPVPGKPDYQHVWQDAQWRFSSAANRDLFASSPDRYAPQYGGFCALGITNGMKAEVDPQAWTIVDGRLYLNYSQDARDRWRQNAMAHIKAADEKWTALRK